MRESNPGLLGEKYDCYLYAMPSPLWQNIYVNLVLPSSKISNLKYEFLAEVFKF